jgi:hypothetical protein
MKITKSLLQKIIHEAIDEVADDDYRASQQQEYEKLEKFVENIPFCGPFWAKHGQLWHQTIHHTMIFLILLPIHRHRENTKWKNGA